MIPQLQFSTRLRMISSRTVKRLDDGLFARRYASQPHPRAPSNNIKWMNRKDNIPVAPPRPVLPVSHGKTSTNQRAPERIVIYHGGTGRTFFIGILRLTTIFVFGASSFIIAPSFGGDEFPWYIAPAVVICSVLPLIFVSYTAAPYVNFVHLELPVLARRSRLEVVEFAKNLPSTAKLLISTTSASLIPRQTEVRLKDLVPDSSLLRPVSFRNKNPARLAWWQGQTLQQFYTADKMKADQPSVKYFPELWEHVYRQIQSRGSLRKNQK